MLLFMYRKKIQGGEEMNKKEFECEMKRFGDTQGTLAEAMGISRTALNCKLNERNGSSFTQPELLLVKERYCLTAERMEEIFFTTNVSK